MYYIMSRARWLLLFFVVAFFYRLSSVSQGLVETERLSMPPPPPLPPAAAAAAAAALAPAGERNTADECDRVRSPPPTPPPTPPPPLGARREVGRGARRTPTCLGSSVGVSTTQQPKKRSMSFLSAQCSFPYGFCPEPGLVKSSSSLV